MIVLSCSMKLHMKRFKMVAERTFWKMATENAKS
jgi:hypothetical protein